MAQLRTVVRGLALTALALLFAATAGGQQPQGIEGAAVKPAVKAPRRPEPEGPPTWYAQALTRGEAGLSVTHFWSKGSKLRAETVVTGHKVVTIVNGEWYYAYDGLTKKGMGIRRDPDAVALDHRDRRPFGDELRILEEQGAEQIAEEQLQGRRTGVFRVTDKAGKRELWITLDEPRLPLRLEIYDRRSRGRRVIDYLNWQSSMPIPDSFFEPDPTIELDRIELDEYVARTIKTGPVGPVPVLYAKLLYREREK